MSTQHQVDAFIYEKVGEMMEECIQTFKAAQRKHLKVKLDFNWYVKSLTIHEFPAVPTAKFGVVNGVLSRKRGKRGIERNSLVYICGMLI